MSSTGDHEVADTVVFTGNCQTVEDGDRLVHGQQGEVTKEPYIGDRVVAALFPESKCSVESNLATVRQHHLSSTRS